VKTLSSCRRLRLKINKYDDEMNAIRRVDVKRVDFLSQFGGMLLHVVVLS